MAENKLYYGDNLDVLRRHVKDESIDLVYLDPPFNSNADYNVLFSRKDGTAATAQIQAFEDTWKWDMAAARALDEVVRGGGRTADAMLAFQRFLGESDMLAYLAMMAPRLKELRRVLKSTGSLYLHCDPTASHYLKMLLDAVFGARQFRADIRWKRTSAHANVKLNYAFVSDQLLYYTKDDKWKWNQPYQPYSDSYIASHYSQRDEDGRRFTTRDLTASMSRASSGQLYDWKGKRPVSTRCWAYTKDNMEDFEARGLLVYGRTGIPRLKLYLDDQPGTPASDIWDDIPPINSQAAERLGYPTQKPQALLERIISASSDQDDVVLDPFCGCGTTVAAAHKLRRRWVGIDVTHLAVNLMKHRLYDTYGPSIVDEYDVIGEPTTVEGAWELSQSDPYQFQFWALGLVGARPHEEKKGADKGIDGRIHFRDPETGNYRDIIISVKAGKPTVSHLRDLRGVVDRENAAIGVLITMQDPTRPMVKEAATGEFYDSPFGQHPSLQLLTIDQLLNGARIDYPRQADVTMKRAPKEHRKDSEQLSLTSGPDPEDN